jgi:hypothetical protein
VKELATPLLSFLDELSELSQKKFSEGGMFVRDFKSTGKDEIAAPIGASANTEDVNRFFACVLGDMAFERPEESSPTATTFIRTLKECYPNGAIHFALIDADGWSGNLEVWIDNGTYCIWFDLYWSID